MDILFILSGLMIYVGISIILVLSMEVIILISFGQMNIYTFLMSKEKNEVNFPKINGANKRKVSHNMKKQSSLLKEARNFSKEQYTYRKTYHDILKGDRHTAETKKNIETQKQKTVYKRTFNTSFMKQTGKSKNETNQPTFPNLPGYKYVRQIGKGGFAQVYEYEDYNANKYAVKEYLLQSSLNCYENEIKIGEHFFDGSKLRQQYREYRGGDNLIGYVKKIRNGKKGYIIQENGGKSLSKITQQIQGTFHKGERVYQIMFSDFHEKLAKQNLLKQILTQIMQGVKLFNRQGFIHCDLKPENILVDWNSEQQTIKCKIIDFGSACQYGVPLPKITITPEYMPPQLLQAIEYDVQEPSLSKVDIWSFGCVLLQLLTGIPLWFRYKCKLSLKGKQILSLGYFSLTNRQYPKIMKKQKQLCQSLSKIAFIHPQFEPYRRVLKRTLVIDSSRRASHDEIIQMLSEMK